MENEETDIIEVFTKYKKGLFLLIGLRQQHFGDTEMEEGFVNEETNLP